jgi:uncharacterized membrane protein YsdA (DUF1294 family)
MSAFKRFAILSSVLFGVLFMLFVFRLKLHPLAAYLAAVNLGTFLLYGIDKLCAVRYWQRVPELLLHFLALAGGSPGALFGQQVYNHKHAKLKFILLYWLIVILQLLLLYAVFYTDLLKTIF